MFYLKLIIISEKVNDIVFYEFDFLPITCLYCHFLASVQHGLNKDKKITAINYDDTL